MEKCSERRGQAAELEHPEKCSIMIQFWLGSNYGLELRAVAIVSIVVAGVEVLRNPGSAGTGVSEYLNPGHGCGRGQKDAQRLIA